MRNFCQQIITIKETKGGDDEKLELIHQEIDNKLDAIIKSVDQSTTNCESEIKKWLLNWEHLNEMTLNFLSSAEWLFSKLPKDDNTDFSPFIIQYCRAIENEILKKLFEAYHHFLKENSIDREQLVQQSLQNDKTKMFANFVLKDRLDYTLGNINTIMSFLKDGGKTLSASILLQDFKKFTLT